MSAASEAQPWLAGYTEGIPAEAAPEFASALDLFDASLERHRESPLVRYFGTSISFGEVDRDASALGAALAEIGVSRGDRVVIQLQNVPAFVIALLASWKLGAIAVPANPMYRERELAELLGDSGARAAIALRSLAPELERAAAPSTPVISVADDDLAAEARGPLAALEPATATDLDMRRLIESHLGADPPDPGLGPDDVAMLVYTSGTTGPPKGAMNTHANVVFSAQTFRDWFPLGPEDRMLGIAPLFHVTGLIGHIAVCMLAGAPLILAYRYDVAETVRLVREEKPTATIAAITAFIALLDAEGADRESFASLRKVISGGAPIPPAVVERVERELGFRIRPVYGLTETTSPSHCTPPGAEAPADPGTGSLAAGVPVSSTMSRILDDDGREVAAGEVGEIAIAGPQVVPGYWERPDETAHALPGGELRTGDLGFMNSEGWFFVVDRKKDQINASGYKVWPREVEEVLYEHPAVREAAVVGIPDEYRGETVKAFVSLNPGSEAPPDELIAFCRERLAAYKYPREVELIDELPKTASGKIMRRELRAKSSSR